MKKFPGIPALVFLLYCVLSPNAGAAADPDSFLTRYFWREVLTLKPQERPRIALVLGGGGARGMAHIGVLRVLEEESFPVDIVVGTSVGALIGGFYASGMSVDEIEDIARQTGWADLTNVTPFSVLRMVISKKLLSTEKLEKYIISRIGDKQFYELKIPFACTATDIRTGEKIIFREGSVAQAVRASANIPGIFEPVEFRHRLLVDGGLVDNIPTGLAKLLKADIIIAVDISSDFTKNLASSVLMVLNQSIYIQGNLLSCDQLKYADLVINPQVSDVTAYELWRYQECIDAGKIACRKMMPQLKRLIIEKTFQRILEKQKK